MTSYLKILATRRTNLKIFPSGCPQLPGIQSTKVLFRIYYYSIPSKLITFVRSKVPVNKNTKVRTKIIFAVYEYLRTFVLVRLVTSKHACHQNQYGERFETLASV